MPGIKWAELSVRPQCECIANSWTERQCYFLVVLSGLMGCSTGNGNHSVSLQMGTVVRDSGHSWSWDRL